MKRFLSYLSDRFYSETAEREKTDKFLVDMDSPEFEALFGGSASSPLKTEDKGGSKQQASPEPLPVSDHPVEDPAALEPNDRASRDTFDAPDATAPRPQTNRDPSVNTIENRLSNLDENTLMGLSRALYKWTDKSLTEKQRNIIIQIVEGLAPVDDESLDTRISRILLLIQARLADQRVTQTDVSRAL